MDTRKRNIRAMSLPTKGQDYTTKKDVAERKSYPQCPPLTLKMNKKRTLPKLLFPETPKAVFFTKPVSLSKLYNKEKEQPYFDQIFTKNDPIGEGSFGIVYKAKSREDDRLYAVKQMKSSHNFQYGYAEVQNCEKVGDHDNCVKFYMAWEEMQIIHIQMEWCQLSLAQYARLTHKIGESQLWDILYDILSALDHLHNKNLIHLDVKPGNIMMSKGIYKLADFGLLVDLNRHDGRKISTISDGDSKYLACEVLDGIYTYSCDIFGLGISLLELATNIELPEFGPLWHEIRKKNLPHSFYEEVTAQFAVTIEKMMAIAHSERPTAAKVLKYSALKKIKKRDMKIPRYNYLNILDDPLDANIQNNNVEGNDIVETPRRPLYEICSSLSYGTESLRDLVMDSSKEINHSFKELEDRSIKLNTNRRGLARTKLTF